jgi:hypothetical protein
MSIKELLKLPHEDLAKLSEAEIKQHFAPYLKMIRPIKEEEKSGPGVVRKRRTSDDELTKTMNLAAKLAAKFGIKEEDI